jgi:exonuclease VII small subunit
LQLGKLGASGCIGRLQEAQQQLGQVTQGREELASKLKGAQDHIEKLCLEKAELNGELATR